MGYSVNDILLSIPENPSFGDYSTNIALQLAKQKVENLNQSPREIASMLSEKILSRQDFLSKIEVAGPGFLNFYLKEADLQEQALANAAKIIKVDQPKKILVEYAQPNTHKAFHIGHLRNITYGESVVRLLESQGHQLYRCTYGSDIGLPVAKAIWGIQQLEDKYSQVKKQDLKTKAEYLGRAYAHGATAYEGSSEAKEQINQLNKALYARDPELVPLWEETRQWSLDYFQTIFQRVGTQFDGVFSESEVEEPGKKIVEENTGEIFIHDNGAVVFPGEMHGLHTRVFITSLGNPTYEAKELGLAELEYNSFPYDLSLHVVGNEQQAYFQVIIKVLELIHPHLKDKKKHLSYGMVNLPTGKMSSRTGEVITADWVFDQVSHQVEAVMKATKVEQKAEVVEQIMQGAIKFAMLRYSAQADIAFDLEKSVSLQGDSGPYLQYSYARTQSVLAKEGADSVEVQQSPVESLEPEERAVLRALNYFNEIVSLAAQEHKPNLLSEYLLELAKVFNLFYQRHRIIESDKKIFRLQITKAVGDTLKTGLHLLGIEALAQM